LGTYGRVDGVVDAPGGGNELRTRSRVTRQNRAMLLAFERLTLATAVDLRSSRRFGEEQRVDLERTENKLREMFADESTIKCGAWSRPRPL